jgi:hypothetical protein
MEEVVGSIPTRSTKPLQQLRRPWVSHRFAFQPGVQSANCYKAAEATLIASRYVVCSTTCVLLTRGRLTVVVVGFSF